IGKITMPAVSVTPPSVTSLAAIVLAVSRQVTNSAVHATKRHDMTARSYYGALDDRPQAETIRAEPRSAWPIPRATGAEARAPRTSGRSPSRARRTPARWRAPGGRGCGRGAPTPAAGRARAAGRRRGGGRPGRGRRRVAGPRG